MKIRVVFILPTGERLCSEPESLSKEGFLSLRQEWKEHLNEMFCSVLDLVGGSVAYIPKQVIQNSVIILEILEEEKGEKDGEKPN